MFNLYDNIKSICKGHGIAVSKMCEEVGISKSTLSNLRNGRTETITPGTARKIAAYLNVSADEIMHGIKEKPVVPENNGLDTMRTEWATAWDNATPQQRDAALAVLKLQVPTDEP